MTSSWIKNCDFTMILINTTEFVFQCKKTLYTLHIMHLFYFKSALFSNMKKTKPNFPIELVIIS